MPNTKVLVTRKCRANHPIWSFKSSDQMQFLSWVTVADHLIIKHMRKIIKRMKVRREKHLYGYLTTFLMKAIKLINKANQSKANRSAPKKIQLNRSCCCKCWKSEFYFLSRAYTVTHIKYLANFLFISFNSTAVVKLIIVFASPTVAAKPNEYFKHCTYESSNQIVANV